MPGLQRRVPCRPTPRPPRRSPWPLPAPCRARGRPTARTGARRARPPAWPVVETAGDGDGLLAELGASLGRGRVIQRDREPGEHLRPQRGVGCPEGPARLPAAGRRPARRWPYLEDRTTIAVAGHLERLLGGLHRRRAGSLAACAGSCSVRRWTMCPVAARTGLTGSRVPWHVARVAHQRSVAGASCGARVRSGPIPAGRHGGQQ